MKKNKKILLAIDGSAQSLTAVCYVSRVFSKQAEVVLFHVEAEIPEVFGDMDVDPETAEADYPFRAWRVYQQQIFNEFLENARGILIDSGFSKKTVSVKTQPMKSGIARDIRNESIQDYNVIVVGRTGLGKQNGILMGSVSAKLVEITSYIPIVVVGAKPETSKILVAFDGSGGSIKSVKCSNCHR